MEKNANVRLSRNLSQDLPYAWRAFNHLVMLLVVLGSSWNYIFTYSPRL